MFSSTIIVMQRNTIITLFEKLATTSTGGPRYISLFICNFAYMRLKNDLFSGSHPLIYGNPRSFYMQIHYMLAYFWSPYLSNITRSTCTYILVRVLVYKDINTQFFYDTLLRPTSHTIYLHTIMR